MSIEYRILLIIRGTFSCSLAAGLIAACEAPPAQDDPSAFSSNRVYSEEERRIAAALSIGRPAILEEEASEYGKAILCKIALDSIAPRLRELTSTEQRAQLAQVEAQVAEQAFVQGGAGGKSRAEVTRDLQARAAQIDDPSVLVPTAMACLRTLL